MIRYTVRNHSAFETDATRLELVAAAGILTVDETHQLGSDVAVVVWRTVRV